MYREPQIPRLALFSSIFYLLLAIAPCMIRAQSTAEPPDPALQPQATEEQPAPNVQQNGEQNKPPAPLDLGSPRATMRAFLVAVESASGDRPEAIEAAVQCLDLSEIQGDDVAPTARKLATRLRDLIDLKGIKLEDIPETLDEGKTEYVFYVQKIDDDAPVAPEVSAPPAIVLARNDQGQWRFTPHTLASIPKIEELARNENLPEEKAPTDVLAARRTARATMETFLTSMRADPPNLEQALLCLNPTGRDPAVWEVTGPELAVKLKTVMDKESRVVLTEISNDSDGPPVEWFSSSAGNIVLARVEMGQAEGADNPFGLLVGEWRFTPQTLRTIGALYDDRIDVAIVRELQEEGVKEVLTPTEWLRRQIPDFLRVELWRLEYWQWIALALILPVGWLIQRVTSPIAGFLLNLWLGRRKFAIEQASRKQVARKIGLFLAVLVWYYVMPVLGLPEFALAILIRATEFALVISLLMVGYRAVDIIGGYVASNREVRLTHFDDVLIPLLRKILRLVIFLVVILFVLNWMDQPPKTVLGALGIGGVALAFAAQDTIGNFFGSLTVLFDRPFGIGDWIVIGDVEGTVEHVGFRSTRVRTFYNSVVTMPNSKMVNTQVDNYGARRYRRTRIMISVTYDTPPEKVDAFCEGIRELIRLHPYTRKDYYHVYFNQFAASSLDILLYVFFEVPDWGTELRERHKLFVDILRLAKRLGVEFAFPTQTLWLQQARAEAESRASVTVDTDHGEPQKTGVEQAAKLFEQAHGQYPVERHPVVIDHTPRSHQKDADTQR